MLTWKFGGQKKKLSKLQHRHNSWLLLPVFVSATCNPGLFFNATLVQCVQCPVGTYQALSGQRACNACPDQKTTLSAGRTSSSDCICEYSRLSSRHLKPEVFLYCLCNTQNHVNMCSHECVPDLFLFVFWSVCVCVCMCVCVCVLDFEWDYVSKLCIMIVFIELHTLIPVWWSWSYLKVT